MMKPSILIVIAVLGATIASPLPRGKEVDGGRVLYDQRQEGEWNVRADLKNFVILIIPSPSTSSSSPLGLLDFFTKSLPTRTHGKRVKVKPTDLPTLDAAEETQHFIEAKTAPYHVDITKAKEELAKLHPGTEEVMLATSPSIALVKTGSDLASTRSARFSKTFIFTVPAEEERYTVTKTEDSKKVVKKDGKKFIKDAPTKFTLELLGAENEQCGPGMERDSEGICRTSKRL